MRCSWLILLVLLAGCARETAPPFRSVVLLPIENLTPDSGRTVDVEALRLAIWESLQAQPALHVVVATHRRNLPELQANFVLDGYLAPNRFQLRINEQPVACAGTLEDCAGRIVTEVAKTIGVTPRAIPKVETLRLLARASLGAASLEPAAAADPFFASVWLGWAGQSQLASGPPAAMAVLQRAPLAQMPAFDAARVKVRMAEFGQNRTVHAKAMSELARLSPADIELQERAAGEAMATRDFASAQAIYERLLTVSRHPRVLNQSAYAAMYLGDRAKAESLSAAAASSAPGEPGYADTRGDIAYYFGDFAAASKYYLQTADLDVTFQGGIELWKAADAARMAGDKATAEGFFHRYEELKTKAGMRNPLLLQAIWEWRGDQPDLALAKFQQAAQTTERGKALFLLSLAQLNRRDAAAAERTMKELDANSIERAFLQSLITGAPPPPGLPVPSEALRALHLYLRGDLAAASTALTAARENIDATQGSQWRRLEALLQKKKPAGLLPASPDDWMSILLR